MWKMRPTHPTEYDKLEERVSRLEAEMAKPRLEKLIEEYERYTPKATLLGEYYSRRKWYVREDTIGFFGHSGQFLDLEYRSESEFIQYVLNPAKVKWAEEHKCTANVAPNTPDVYVSPSTRTTWTITTRSDNTAPKRRRKSK